MPEVSAWTRRVLARRVRIGGLAEVLLWLTVGYLAVGSFWALFHPAGVDRIQAQLEQELQLPIEMHYQLAALGEASILWPVMLVLPSPTCAH